MISPPLPQIAEKRNESTMRTVEYVRATGRGKLIEIEFSADGFLYKIGANDGGRDGALCPGERESAINRVALGAALADIGSFCCSGSRALPGPGSLLSLCKSGINALLRGFRLAD